MTEEIKRYPLSAPGKYYIDCNTCLDHELCADTAPNNIRINEEGWVAYVYKQPNNPEEEAQCRQALEECPVFAIRDDG
jgi:ferredoxin